MESIERINMLEKIKEEEIQFMEAWHTVRELVECLFSNFNDMGEFEEELGHFIRFYQFPMLSQEPLIDFETTAKHHNLTEQQAFKLRINVGSVINLGARNYGKTLITLKLDMGISLLHDDKQQNCFYSIDEKRLRGVLEQVRTFCEYHPIGMLWKVKCGYKPDINFKSNRNGWELIGVNLTIRGKDPGHQFYQIHAKKTWGEEVSFETQDIADKREESEDEMGAIVRLAGMTNFTKNSPIGKMFFDKKKKNRVCNYPQYVSPYWDEEKKERKVTQYGGEDEPKYRVFVGGEVLTESEYEFDMERIEPFINRKKKIIRFELKKDRFKMFRNYIIIERPKNADRIFVVADIGDGAKGATEIIILAEIGDKYKPLYNITLYNYKHDEQLAVFKYIIEKMEANVIALDCGEALGRTLADDFESLYSEENVVRYAGNSKVIVGFEKKIVDGKEVLKTDKKGNLIPKEEFMSEWSVRRQKELLYGGRVALSEDTKFEKQFENVVSTNSGTRVVYDCLNSSGDHYWSAWKVFTIAQWLKKDFNQTPKVNQEWGASASSWVK